ncbi:hypothetical protein OF83DRAFT_1138444 [Amylostereum chailletii]|nr:hypothetical protein OF83DRAFT_1138444 [Amylostereum chailletii]
MSFSVKKFIEHDHRSPPPSTWPIRKGSRRITPLLRVCFIFSWAVEEPFFLTVASSEDLPFFSRTRHLDDLFLTSNFCAFVFALGFCLYAVRALCDCASGPSSTCYA